MKQSIRGSDVFVKEDIRSVLQALLATNETLATMAGADVQQYRYGFAAARHLMALYGGVIDSEEQYGELTGRFSDTLGVKRDLTNMIAHLADLIAAIEHPEEVTPDA